MTRSIGVATNCTSFQAVSGGIGAHGTTPVGSRRTGQPQKHHNRRTRTIETQATLPQNPWKCGAIKHSL